MTIYSKKALSFTSRAEATTSKLFYKSFLKKMESSLIEFFGEDEAFRCMEFLSKKSVKILNPETFFFNTDNMGDTSFDIYNTSKSAEEFIHGCTLKFIERAEYGETYIEIREFFLILADMLSKETRAIDENNLRGYLKNFLLQLSKTTAEPPFKLVLTIPEETTRLSKVMGLDVSMYKLLFTTIISCIKDLQVEDLPTRLFLPTLEVAMPVYKDTRYPQVRYLSRTFRIPTDSVEKLIKNIPSLSKDTTTLRVAIEQMAAKRDVSFDMELVLADLAKIERDTPFRTYSTQNSLTDPFRIRSSSIGRKDISTHIKNFKFVDRDSFESSFIPYLAHIEITCNKKTTAKSLEPFLDCCKTIGMLKYYHLKTQKVVEFTGTPTFKITLRNVPSVTSDFTEAMQNKIARMNSITDKNFIIEVCYDEDEARRKDTLGKPTHFRVIGDIHADYNKDQNYSFNFGEDFVINCGDTGGNAKVCIEWNKTYIKKGVTVVGNHFGYSPSHPELDGIQNMEKYGSTTHEKNTKNTQIHELGKNLTGQQCIRLLSNSMTEYEGIIILGTTLYTDFALYGKDHIEECMQYAKKCMNDFRYPMVVGHREYSLTPEGEWKIKMRKRSESKVRPFTPYDHAYFFHHSFNFLKEKVLEYKHKPIIIVTHHAPSPYSISEEYKGDLLNAAFVSNLNEFIVSNPQIRLWCHGHTHTPFDYILGQTRVICCPFGYNNENNYKLPNDYGTRILISDIKNKKPWTEICEEFIENGDIKYYPS